MAWLGCVYFYRGERVTFERDCKRFVLSCFRSVLHSLPWGQVSEEKGKNQRKCFFEKER